MELSTMGYELKLTNKEMNIVCKALCGRLRTEGEIDEANRLGIRINQGKINLAKNLYESMLQLEVNMNIEQEETHE